MSREIVFAGKRIQVAVETREVEGKQVRREIVLHPGSAAILALPEPGHVCLLRNRRDAVGETLWEIPAGTLEPPEPPDVCAVRELAEETGYQARRWRKLAEIFPSPGILSEHMYLFQAEDLIPGPMHLEPGEELAPQVVAWTEALRWIQDGTIRDAKTVVALLLWDRLRSGVSETSAEQSA
jgi:ADP-ribose pyrophosphatase